VNGPLLVVGIGVLGGVGSVARFAVDGAVSRKAPADFPYGSLAVNLLGAFLLGVLLGAAAGPNAYRLVATGLLGAFTTFSTWMFESRRLTENGRFRAAAANVAMSLVLGLLAVWIGRRLGTAL